MLQPIEKLDKAGLRKFGITTGILFGIFIGGLMPWIWSVPFPRWPWYVTAAFCASGLIVPIALKPIYYGWMTIGNLLGWINTRILMGIIFYALFWPFGWAIKLFGKDLLSLKLDSSEKSYRKESQLRDSKHFYNPY